MPLPYSRRQACTMVPLRQSDKNGISFLCRRWPVKTYLLICQPLVSLFYGGTIPVSTISITCRNALAEMFNVQSIIPGVRLVRSNLQVCHNGTDKRNPNFDIFQDMQSQNDYNTAPLNDMG